MKKMSLKRREDPLWNSPDPVLRRVHRGRTYIGRLLVLVTLLFEIGSASCRERV